MPLVKDKKPVFSYIKGIVVPVEIVKDETREVRDEIGNVLHTGDDCLDFIRSDTTHFVLYYTITTMERRLDRCFNTESAPQVRTYKGMFYRPLLTSEFCETILD